MKKSAKWKSHGLCQGAKLMVMFTAFSYWPIFWDDIVQSLDTESKSAKLSCLG